jgi:hypothetical protein
LRANLAKTVLQKRAFFAFLAGFWGADNDAVFDSARADCVSVSAGI